MLRIPRLHRSRGERLIHSLISPFIQYAGRAQVLSPEREREAILRSREQELEPEALEIHSPQELLALERHLQYLDIVERERLSRRFLLESDTGLRNRVIIWLNRYGLQVNPHVIRNILFITSSLGISLTRLSQASLEKILNSIFHPLTSTSEKLPETIEDKLAQHIDFAKNPIRARETQREAELIGVPKSDLERINQIYQNRSTLSPEDQIKINEVITGLDFYKTSQAGKPWYDGLVLQPLTNFNYVFLGPGTDLADTIKGNKQPVNLLDAIAQEHDYRYWEAAGYPDNDERIHHAVSADRNFVRQTEQLVNNISQELKRESLTPEDRKYLLNLRVDAEKANTAIKYLAIPSNYLAGGILGDFLDGFVGRGETLSPEERSNRYKELIGQRIPKKEEPVEPREESDETTTGATGGSDETTTGGSRRSGSGRSEKHENLQNIIPTETKEMTTEEKIYKPEELRGYSDRYLRELLETSGGKFLVEVPESDFGYAETFVVDAKSFNNFLQYIHSPNPQEVVSGPIGTKVEVPPAAIQTQAQLIDEVPYSQASQALGQIARFNNPLQGNPNFGVGQTISAQTFNKDEYMVSQGAEVALTPEERAEEDIWFDHWKFIPPGHGRGNQQVLDGLPYPEMRNALVRAQNMNDILRYNGDLKHGDIHFAKEMSYAADGRDVKYSKRKPPMMPGQSYPMVPKKHQLWHPANPYKATGIGKVQFHRFSMQSTPLHNRYDPKVANLFYPNIVDGVRG
jgi:hypothetical protein